MLRLIHAYKNSFRFAWFSFSKRSITIIIREKIIRHSESYLRKFNLFWMVVFSKTPIKIVFRAKVYRSSQLFMIHYHQLSTVYKNTVFTGRKRAQMNQLTNCQTGIKTKGILNMLKIELVTLTCATWSFLV